MGTTYISYNSVFNAVATSIRHTLYTRIYTRCITILAYTTICDPLACMSPCAGYLVLVGDICLALHCQHLHRLSVTILRSQHQSGRAILSDTQYTHTHTQTYRSDTHSERERERERERGVHRHIDTCRERMGQHMKDNVQYKGWERRISVTPVCSMLSLPLPDIPYTHAYIHGVSPY